MSKLSVAIITFNEERYIEECLKSLINVADEIIVVDSFSTDKTKMICKKYNVVFIEQKFLGYIEQKNFALKKAKYDYIVSLDGDESLSKTLQESINKLKSNEASICVVGLGYVGLPLALEFAKKFNVVGYDFKADRVEMMKKNQDPSQELDSSEFENRKITFTIRNRII